MLLSLVEIRLLIAVSLSLMFQIERSIFDDRHFTAVKMDVVDCLRSYNSFFITDSSVVTILGNSLQVIQSHIPTGLLFLSRPRHCSCNHDIHMLHWIMFNFFFRFRINCT